MIYLQLFISFLQIGAFSFGGGYAAMPLIQNQVVQVHPWLSQSEFEEGTANVIHSNNYNYCIIAYSVF